MNTKKEKYKNKIKVTKIITTIIIIIIMKTIIIIYKEQCQTTFFWVKAFCEAKNTVYYLDLVFLLFY